MILSDFNFSADHTQFDVQKQTVQLNRGKRDLLLFLSVWKTFYGLYSVLLLSTFSSVVVFFPSGFSSFYFMLALLERPLLFILSSARILALVFLLFLLIFVIFFIFTLSFFVDTVSICTVTCAVIFADVSNLSTFTSTVVIDCYFFLLLFALFLLISCCFFLALLFLMFLLMSDCAVSTISTYILYCFYLLFCFFCKYMFY